MIHIGEDAKCINLRIKYEKLITMIMFQEKT